jgi:hypothetical protein
MWSQDSFFLLASDDLEPMIEFTNLQVDQVFPRSNNTLNDNLHQCSRALKWTVSVLLLRNFEFVSGVPHSTTLRSLFGHVVVWTRSRSWQHEICDAATSAVAMDLFKIKLRIARGFSWLPRLFPLHPRSSLSQVLLLSFVLYLTKDFDCILILNCSFIHNGSN